MATVPLSMDTIGTEPAVIPFAPSGMGNQRPARKLHRIRELRKQQGVSLRTASRKLCMPASQVREEEKADSDLLVSQLIEWAEVLDVPIADLLEEPQNNLSSPIRERAKLVRIMKTVKAISERTQEPNIGILAEVLVDQLVDLMPELKEISAWNNVGQRRSMNDLGQIAERRISCDAILGAMHD